MPSPCSVSGEDGRDALHDSGHVGVWVSIAEKREDMLHLVNRDEKGLSTAVAAAVAGMRKRPMERVVPGEREGVRRGESVS